MAIALVVNDTKDNYHYGCFATSTMLHRLLLDDSYEVVTISVDRAARSIPSPGRVDDLACPVFYRNFAENNADIITKIMTSAIVVINGEGTLHGFSNRPRNLLYLISVAKHFHKKPTYLVNHSLFPTDFPSETNDPVFAFYKAAVGLLDGVAPREGRSQSIYERMGIPSVQAFDLLPLYAHTEGIDQEGEPRDETLVVAGLGVGWSPQQALALARVLKACLPGGRRIQLLNGAPVQEPPEENALPALMHSVDDRITATFSPNRVRSSSTDEVKEWIKTIRRASLVVTGRYHHVVAALAMGTPAIAFTSNTDKIESTLNLFGLRPDPIDPRSNLFEVRLQALLSNALRSKADTLVATEQQRAQILTLARANRIWPHASLLQ